MVITKPKLSATSALVEPSSSFVRTCSLCDTFSGFEVDRHKIESKRDKSMEGISSSPSLFRRTRRERLEVPVVYCNAVIVPSPRMVTALKNSR